MNFGSYHPSESTIIGIATIVGAGIALATHELNAAAAIPLLAGGLTSVLIPGNAGAKIAGEQAASQIVAAIQDKAPGPAVAVALGVAGAAFAQSVEKAAASQPSTEGDHAHA